MIPEVDLAITVHSGPHNSEIDRAYGSLAAHVTDHALAIDGPIRECYLVGPPETNDESQSRIEIGWPIFHTGQPSSRANEPLGGV